MSLNKWHKDRVTEAPSSKINNNSKLMSKFSNNKLLISQGHQMMGLTYLTRKIYNPTISTIIAPRVEK